MLTIGELQHRLMPKELPVMSGWEVAVNYLVNCMPGGDYYDFFPCPGGHWGLVVADASGHGGAAAVLVAQVRAFLHACPLTCGQAQSPFCPVAACAPQPDQLLAHLGRLLE